MGTGAYRRRVQGRGDDPYQGAAGKEQAMCGCVVCRGGDRKNRTGSYNTGRGQELLMLVMW